MREQEPIIRGYIDKFIVKLHENAGQPLDMCKWYNFVSFDLIGDLVFGESFQCLEENKLHVRPPHPYPLPHSQCLCHKY